MNHTLGGSKTNFVSRVRYLLRHLGELPREAMFRHGESSRGCGSLARLYFGLLRVQAGLARLRGGDGGGEWPGASVRGFGAG